MTFGKLLTKPELHSLIAGLLNNRDSGLDTSIGVINLNQLTAKITKTKTNYLTDNTGLKIYIILNLLYEIMPVIPQLQNNGFNSTQPSPVFIPIDKYHPATDSNTSKIKKDSNGNIPGEIFDLQDFIAIINDIIESNVQEYFNRKVDNIPWQEQYRLTDREKEIVNKLLQGLGYKQIACECSITRETLNSHMKNIYRKLNVHSRAEVAARFSGYFRG